MGKLTQKQRRELNNRQNLNDKTEHYDLTYNENNNETYTMANLNKHILSLYPDVRIVNISNTLYTNNRISKQVKQIDDLTRDDNNFIVIENRDHKHLEKLVRAYLLNKKAPMKLSTYQFIKTAFVLFRSANFIMCPKCEMNNDHEVFKMLKTHFKQSPKECMLCYKEFEHNEKKVTCCNCKTPICSKCFFLYLKSGNSGWCPFCTQHMMFYGLTKMDTSCEVINDLYDEYVCDKLWYNFKKNGDTDGVRIEMSWFMDWEEYLHDRIDVVDDEP